jgi:hypothetical protein
LITLKTVWYSNYIAIDLDYCQNTGTGKLCQGLPATVAPVGLSESGLPVGVQIIGARFEDRTTIAFAQGLSELIGGFVAPPGMRIRSEKYISIKNWI